MKEKLIYKVNNIEYLLVEKLIIKSSQSDYINKMIKKFKAIEQGFGEIKKGGIVSSGYIILKILVPCKNINKWIDAFRDK